jgi:hypothetical protein
MTHPLPSSIRIGVHESGEQVATAGRFEILHNDATDSIVIADTVSHDDIAEVFHNERHTVSQSVYQARETAQLFAASVDMLTALRPFAALLDALEAQSNGPKKGVWYATEISGVGVREISIEDFQAARAAIEKATAL